MNMSIAYRTIIFIALWGILAGCAGRNAEQKKVDQPLDTLVSEVELLDDCDLEVLLPSPSEVLEVVITSGMKYSEKIAAPLGIEDDALLIRNKAMIMGVYLADFSYYNIFSQSKMVAEYFNAIQVLARDMGISSVLNDAYFRRFDNNINNLDSVDKIYSEFALYAYGTLVESGNNEILSLIAIGSAIEILYMGLVSNNNIGDEVVTTKMLEQKDLFENYYQNYIKYNHAKPEFEPLNKDLDSLYNLYRSKLSEEKHSVVVTDGVSHFTIKNVSRAKISNADVERIKEKVFSVREKLINLKY